jgi:hypothetical protein
MSSNPNPNSGRAFRAGRSVGIAAIDSGDFAPLRAALAVWLPAPGVMRDIDARNFIWGTLHGAADAITAAPGGRGIITAAGMVADHVGGAAR